MRYVFPLRRGEYVQPVCRYFSNDKNAFLPQYEYFEGQWECIQYYLSIKKELLYTFSHGKPNAYNQYHIDRIKNEDSVGIHVRRGDYLHSELFRGICDLDYYQRGIEMIQKDSGHHSFYIFSNDIKWCQENLSPLLKGSEVFFITDNSGKKSCWDLFLMTYCKDLIIANSTFSWWGAFLNQRGGKIIAPMRWFNRDADYDIWENDWIRI